MRELCLESNRISTITNLTNLVKLQKLDLGSPPTLPHYPFYTYTYIYLYLYTSVHGPHRDRAVTPCFSVYVSFNDNPGHIYIHISPYDGTGKNLLTSVSGLGHLVNLTQLSLEDNRVTSTRGLETLANLMELYLGIHNTTTSLQIHH